MKINRKEKQFRKNIDNERKSQKQKARNIQYDNSILTKNKERPLEK